MWQPATMVLRIALPGGGPLEIVYAPPRDPLKGLQSWRVRFSKQYNVIRVHEANRFLQNAFSIFFNHFHISHQEDDSCSEVILFGLSLEYLDVRAEEYLHHALVLLCSRWKVGHERRKI